jgi:hypothetical protein
MAMGEEIYAGMQKNVDTMFVKVTVTNRPVNR